MSAAHYENFPVASVLLPKKLRHPVKTIYAFARSADDIADEGNDLPEVRQEKLDAYLEELDRIEQGLLSDSALFRQLDHVIRQNKLPLQPFRDLISAFRQDIVITRYATYDCLLDYCRRSANPVGILMLHLYNAISDENLVMSDAICTALQLINFWQDIAIDWKKNRIYLPGEDMDHFGVTEELISQGIVNSKWQAMMHFEIDRTRQLMLSGAHLARRIPGRTGWELRFIVRGGLRILEKIELADYDIFNKRPVLQKTDWLNILKYSLFYSCPS